MTAQLFEFWKSFSRSAPTGFFENAPVLMYSINAQGDLTQVNEVWAAKLGNLPEEMIGWRWTKFLAAESQNYAIKMALPEFMAAKKIDDVPYNFVCRGGSISLVLLSAIAKYDSDSAFVGSLAIVSGGGNANVR